LPRTIPHNCGEGAVDIVAVKETVYRYRWVMLGVAFVVQFANALATQAVAPLAPLFQPELGLSKSEVGLFSSIIFAGSWGVLVVAGSLCDRLGLRRLMSVALVIVGLVILSMVRVGYFFEAAVVMFLAGVGGGVVMPGSTKAIMDWFPPRARATGMGIKQAGVPLAGIITASTLPVIALTVGWRAAIAGVGFAIIASGVITGLFCRDLPRTAKEVEKRPPFRVVFHEVVRNRGLWAVSSISVLYVTAQLSLITYVALFLKEVVLVNAIPDEHTRIVAAGGYLALCQAGGVFGRVFWGVVSDRLFQGRRMAVMALIGGLSGGFSLLMAVMGPDFPLVAMPPLMFLFGATAIGWNGIYHASMAETSGQKYAATGTGMSMTLNQFGVVGGPPLFGFIVDVSGSYAAGWIMMALCCAIGVVVSLFRAKGEVRNAEAGRAH
jgi:MFS transporter, ACS family, hexuronate transporter